MEYGASPLPNREDAPCRPDSPYGLSRLAATLRARQLAQRFGVPTRVARVFTLFGETDAEGRLVGRLVARLRDGQSVGIAPATSRDICDVADVAAGYVALAFNAARGPLFEIFNLSRGAAMPLTEFAHIVAARLGADSKLIKEDSAMVRRNEGAALAGDNLKAHLLLGWAPQDLETGIYRLIREFDLVTN
jgi:GDP-4-dehydro-6-deoxy-D-mannose reductase